MTSASQGHKEFLNDILRASRVMDDEGKGWMPFSSENFATKVATNVGLFKWTAALAVLGKLLPYEVEVITRVETLKDYPMGIEHFDGSPFATGSSTFFSRAVKLESEERESYLVTCQRKLSDLQELRSHVEQYLNKMFPCVDTKEGKLVIPLLPTDSQDLADLDKKLEDLVENRPTRDGAFGFILFDSVSWKNIHQRWSDCSESFREAQLPVLVFTASRARQYRTHINFHVLRLAEAAIGLPPDNNHRIAAQYFLKENGFGEASILDQKDIAGQIKKKLEALETTKQCSTHGFKWKLTTP